MESLFKYLVLGVFLTFVAVIGIVCNSLTLYILHDKDVKLKRDFVQCLCAMTIYDNLFLVCAFFLFALPVLSVDYEHGAFNYIVPYLFPITNTLMTCSCYMTVAVSLNRCFGTITAGRRGRSIPRIKNGYVQALIVLFVSASINAPRWLEFGCCKYTYVMKNVTDDTGKILEMNVTDDVMVIVNPIRDRYEYIRDYIVIASNVLTLLLPMILLIIAAALIYKEMARTANLTAGLLSDADETSRRRRNQSITFMLIGIIFLFIFCRVGELLVSIYELAMMLRYETRVDFPESVKAITDVNHFLLVCNSSLNFAIYCKDVFFRQCLLKLIRALRGNTRDSNSTNSALTTSFTLKEMKPLSRESRT